MLEYSLRYSDEYSSRKLLVSGSPTRYSIETVEWTELVFRTEATCALLSRAVLQWNSGIFKNKGRLTSLSNLLPNSELGHFYVFFSPQHVDRRNCCQLSLTVASLSRWASTLVCNTLAVAQNVARFVLHGKTRFVYGAENKGPFTLRADSRTAWIGVSAPHRTSLRVNAP